MVKTRAKAELIRQLERQRRASRSSSARRRRATATGASCSARWSGSTRSPRPTSAASPTRRSSDRTARSDASRPTRRHRAKQEKPVNDPPPHAAFGSASGPRSAPRSSSRPCAARPGAGEGYREDPEARRCRKFAVPQPEAHRFANGMLVFLMEDRELPLIDAFVRDPRRLARRAGRQGGPRRRSTGRSGAPAAPRRRPETRSTTSSRRAPPRSRPPPTSIPDTVSLSCLKGDFDAVLAVFDDVLRRPAFREDKIDLAKTRPAGRHRAAQRRCAAASPAARRPSSATVRTARTPAQPEYATVDAVTRADLVAWHKQIRPPEPHRFSAVVGDFDTAAMEAKLRKAFERLAEGHRGGGSGGGLPDDPCPRRLLRRQGRRQPVQHPHGRPRDQARQPGLLRHRGHERGPGRRLLLAPGRQRALEEGPGLLRGRRRRRELRPPGPAADLDGHQERVDRRRDRRAARRGPEHRLPAGHRRRDRSAPRKRSSTPSSSASTRRKRSCASRSRTRSTATRRTSSSAIAARSRRSPRPTSPASRRSTSTRRISRSSSSARPRTSTSRSRRSAR